MKKMSMPKMAMTGPASPLGPFNPTGPSLDMSKMKAPGGSGGFLINPNSYSDSHAVSPPASRGAKKSAGYPSFAKSR